MIRLIQIEINKLIPKISFWILTGGFAIVLGLVIWFFQDLVNQSINDVSEQSAIGNLMEIPEVSLYNFPGIWSNLSFIANFIFFTWLIVFLGMVMITDEFNFKTVRMSIMNGMSRRSFFLSKLLMMFLLALFAGVLLFILGLVLGLIHSPSLSGMFSGVSHVPAFVLQTFGFLTIGFMLAILVRKLVISFIIFVIYSIGEFILAEFINKDIASFLPFKSIDNLIRLPESQLMRFFGQEFHESMTIKNISLTLGYIILFSLVSWLFFRKKDF